MPTVSAEIVEKLDTIKKDVTRRAIQELIMRPDSRASSVIEICAAHGGVYAGFDVTDSKKIILFVRLQDGKSYGITWRYDEC